MSPNIFKASGVSEELSQNKIRHSLELSKVPDHTIPEVVRFVDSHLDPNGSTTDLHNLIRQFLIQKGLYAQSFDYDLRRAVMRLGPSGYPFEKYVAQLLNALGYDTKVGQTIKGGCISHEIDIVAHQASKHFLVECKYHNQPGTKTDVQVALYTYARFLDIISDLVNAPTHQTEQYQSWLITNTKVSKDAIQYSNCQKMNLISWSYPAKGNLKDWILETKHFPVTSITSLNDRQISALLNQDIVSCINLHHELKTRDLSEIIPSDQKSSILSQIEHISK